MRHIQHCVDICLVLKKKMTQSQLRRKNVELDENMHMWLKVNSELVKTC